MIQGFRGAASRSAILHGVLLDRSRVDIEAIRRTNSEGGKAF